MKRVLDGIAKAFPVILLVFMAAAVIAMLGVIVQAGKNQTLIKVMQRQIAVESVRRGYAEPVVNTNTGNFAVRLKEVAP